MAINESWPWRQMLLRDAATLERWCAKTRDTERRLFLIEQKVFIAAYSIRKLHEARKLSTSFVDRSVRCESYPPASTERLTLSNSHRLHELYDLRTEGERTVPARRLMDLVIHSLAFGQVVNEDDTVYGFLLTSDRTREEFLLSVPMVEFVRLMREVGEDHPSTAAKFYDPDKDDYETWQGHGDPPAEFVARMMAARKAD